MKSSKAQPSNRVVSQQPESVVREPRPSTLRTSKLLAFPGVPTIDSMKALQDTIRCIQATEALLEKLSRLGLIQEIRNEGSAKAKPAPSWPAPMRLTTTALLLASAQERECSRIARDLHDDISQRLAIVEIGLARLNDVIEDPKAARPQLATLRAVLADVSRDVQNMAHGLHPAILNDLGLDAALRELCRQTHQGRALDMDFRSFRVPKYLPESVSTAFYRIAQEALRNASKYARGAPVTMRLRFVRGTLQMLINDKGPGFEMSRERLRRGLGFTSMRERAHLAGGAISIDSKPGRGTRILVEAPVPQHEFHPSERSPKN